MVRVIEPSVEIFTPLNGNEILKHLERCARNCYKSEDKIMDESAPKMIKKLIDLGHEAMIEHFSISLKIIADTGVLKDITRHRLVSFAVESTRYCLYAKDKFGNEISVMKPVHIPEGSPEYEVWLNCMKDIEKAYLKMAELGCKADACRMVLPHSTKAEIIMTANLREWRHVLRLRTAPAAHPTVQQIMKMVLREFKKNIPVVFDDIPLAEEQANSIAAE